jgi:uroporphyrinogen-III decarboxylase
MNGYQRIKAALAGEQPDKIPVMLHNFMMAAHESGVTMKQFRNNPSEIARCFIESVEKYHYDGIIVDIDTATLAGACGVPIDFPENTPTRCSGKKLKSIKGLENLEMVDIQNYWGIQVWLEATQLLKTYFKDDIWIRGNCDQCPFSLASLIRCIEDWMTDLLDESNHQLIVKLLNYCTEVTIQFIRLMVDTGADMVSNGDIIGDEKTLTISDFNSGKTIIWDSTKNVTRIDSGHGGGDFGLVHDFIQAVSEQDESLLSSTIDASMESHLMGFKAEESRLSGKTVQVKLI